MSAFVSPSFDLHLRRTQKSSILHLQPRLYGPEALAVDCLLAVGFFPVQQRAALPFAQRKAFNGINKVEISFYY